MGSVGAIKLTPHEKAVYPAKLTPKYAGPWVVVERYANGITYRVRDVATNEERQVTRTQFKLLDLPHDEPAEPTLPRLLVEDLGREEGNTCSKMSTDRGGYTDRQGTLRRISPAWV